MQNTLSDDGARTLLTVADGETRRAPMCASGLRAEDLNELCAAGLVELTIADDVMVTLSPMGRKAAADARRARAADDSPTRLEQASPPVPPEPDDEPSRYDAAVAERMARWPKS